MAGLLSLMVYVIVIASCIIQQISPQQLHTSSSHANLNSQFDNATSTHPTVENITDVPSQDMFTSTPSSHANLNSQVDNATSTHPTVENNTDVPSQDVFTSTHSTAGEHTNKPPGDSSEKESINSSSTMKPSTVSNKPHTTWTQSTAEGRTNNPSGQSTEDENIHSIPSITPSNVSDTGQSPLTHSTVERISDTSSDPTSKQEHVSLNTSMETITQSNAEDNATNQTVGRRKKYTIIQWAVEVVITSVIAVLGMVGNCISVCVLASPRMKSSNSVILIFLAFFDTLLLLRHILFKTMPYILSQSMSAERLTETFTLPVHVIYRCVENVAYFGSVYTTVLLTLERCAVVMFPLRAVSMCTIKHARIFGLVILCAAIIYNIPKFVLVTMHVENDPITNLTKFVVMRRWLSTETKLFYKVTRKYLDVVILLAIPALLLVVCNSCIVYKLWQRSRLFNKASSSVSGQHSAGTDRITAMTMAITVTFCVNLIMINVDRDLCLVKVNVDAHLPPVCKDIHLASDFIYTFNSAINFVYYCLFGAKFRRVFFSLCTRRVQTRHPSTSTLTQEPQI